MTNASAQIRFLIRCKKHNLIPNGLNRKFFTSISNFLSLGRDYANDFNGNYYYEYCLLNTENEMLGKKKMKYVYKNRERFVTGDWYII